MCSSGVSTYWEHDCGCDDQATAGGAVPGDEGAPARSHSSAGGEGCVGETGFGQFYHFVLTSLLGGTTGKPHVCGCEELAEYSLVFVSAHVAIR